MNFEKQLIHIRSLDKNLKIRLFFFAVTVLNAIAIIVFALAPELDMYGIVPHAINLTITIIFSFEYIWHIFTTKKKLRYVFSISGIVQLLSIFPITAIELQGVRLLKVIVGFSLYRQITSKPNDKTYENQFWKIIKSESGLLLWSLFSVLLIIMASAFIIFSLEHNVQPDVFRTPFDSVWWAFQTVSTVGYGDIVPITTQGRIIAMILSIVGIASFSIPTTLISTRFIQQNRSKRLNDDMKDSIHHREEVTTIEALERLNKLKADKAIDETEYEKLKAKLMK